MKPGLNSCKASFDTRNAIYPIVLASNFVISQSKLFFMNIVCISDISNLIPEIPNPNNFWCLVEILPKYLQIDFVKTQKKVWERNQVKLFLLWLRKPIFDLSFAQVFPLNIFKITNTEKSSHILRTFFLKICWSYQENVTFRVFFHKINMIGDQ